MNKDSHKAYIDAREREEPPTKRRRLSGAQDEIMQDQTDARKASNACHNVEVVAPTREYDVGIRAFVNDGNLPFVGTLKTRYTDFLVNEILPNGTVVHLKNMRAPRIDATDTNEQTKFSGHDDKVNSEPEANDQQSSAGLASKHVANIEDTHVQPKDELPTISDEQQKQLIDYLNETAATEMLALYDSINTNPKIKASQHPVVRTEFTSDRSVRSQIHQFIRETFQSKIESSTDHDGILVLKASQSVGRNKQRGGQKSRDQRPGKLGWQDRGGEYVHFTLYKENRDTMESISWLTKQLRCNAKIFQFAGTKDRRAVTSQRCSAYRIEAERLAAQNQSLRGSKIGDFEYHTQGLELGELGGNEFVITLRDCRMERREDIDLEVLQNDMQARMKSLRDNGYLNYYGEQRFGTFSVRTDVIGQHILREDLQAACNAILSYQDDALIAAQDEVSATTIGQDDKNRALAIHKWRTDRALSEALDILPRKFSAEAQVMRHLHRHGNDFLGALLSIQRNLRLMYVHAYQSLVWNMAASKRSELYGSKVVTGDLVLVKEHKDKEIKTEHTNGITIDADGEQIVQPGEDDRATNEDDYFDRARALTEEEAASGQYSIFDIVLPQPGYDVLYPENAAGEYYSTFMKSEEGGQMDPFDMRRKHRDFSLSGSYRKVFARIGEDYEARVHRYEKDDEQFVKTDMDVIQEEKKKQDMNQEVEAESNGAAEQNRNKLAVVLKFQLGSSQYATMVLRELSRGGIVPYKPDFSGGR